MHISSEKVAWIKDTAWELFGSRGVYLFASRVDESLCGGDIDLCIETEQTEKILETKLILLCEFDKTFDEQKVDLLINNHTKQKEISKIAQREWHKTMTTLQQICEELDIHFGRIKQVLPELKRLLLNKYG